MIKLFMIHDRPQKIGTLKIYQLGSETIGDQVETQNGLAHLGDQVGNRSPNLYIFLIRLS